MARRYYLDPLPAPGACALPESIAHHLARVMRRTAGARILLFDGHGREAEAELTAVEGGRVRAEVKNSYPCTREPACRLELAIALPKASRAEWLFEHGTEVGIAAFRPVETERSTARKMRRTERWERILQAAAGQCDRGVLPTLHEPVAFADLLRLTLPRERYIADPAGPPLEAARSTAAVLLVGPEGGLTEPEREAATAAGFAPRSLGPLTLRTETAALVGAALLLQGAPPHDAGTE